MVCDFTVSIKFQNTYNFIYRYEQKKTYTRTSFIFVYWSVFFFRFWVSSSIHIAITNSKYYTCKIHIYFFVVLKHEANQQNIDTFIFVHIFLLDIIINIYMYILVQKQQKKTNSCIVNAIFFWVLNGYFVFSFNVFVKRIEFHNCILISLIIWDSIMVDMWDWFDWQKNRFYGVWYICLLHFLAFL